MHVYLSYIFIRLMLLRLCLQHYFILVMNPVTFYNNYNNHNDYNKNNNANNGNGDNNNSNKIMIK